MIKQQQLRAFGEASIDAVTRLLTAEGWKETGISVPGSSLLFQRGKVFADLRREIGGVSLWQVVL